MIRNNKLYIFYHVKMLIFTYFENISSSVLLSGRARVSIFQLMLTLLRSDILTALIDSGQGSANSYGNSAEIEVVCGPLLDCWPPILTKKEKWQLNKQFKIEIKMFIIIDDHLCLFYYLLPN